MGRADLGREAAVVVGVLGGLRRREVGARHKGLFMLEVLLEAVQDLVREVLHYLLAPQDGNAKAGSTEESTCGRVRFASPKGA